MAEAALVLPFVLPFVPILVEALLAAALAEGLLAGLTMLMAWGPFAAFRAAGGALAIAAAPIRRSAALTMTQRPKQRPSPQLPKC